MSQDPLISVVVCSIDERRRRAIRQHYKRLLRGRHEFILIPDAKSLCEGYNRGFRQSTGEIVIFSHDDIEIISDDFAARLLRHFTGSDLVGVIGTSKICGPSWITAGPPFIHGLVAHPEGERYRLDWFGPATDAGQAFDGIFFAAKRAVCEAIPFDEITFDGFHYYDIDFTFRAFEAGFKLKMGLDILMIHYGAGLFDEVWRGYAERFADKFGRDRIDLLPVPRPQWASRYFDSKGALIGYHRQIVAQLLKQTV